MTGSAPGRNSDGFLQLALESRTKIAWQGSEEKQHFEIPFLESRRGFRLFFRSNLTKPVKLAGVDLSPTVEPQGRPSLNQTDKFGSLMKNRPGRLCKYTVVSRKKLIDVRCCWIYCVWWETLEYWRDYLYLSPKYSSTCLVSVLQ